MFLIGCGLRRNRSSASDSAYSYTFLRSVVCRLPSVVWHISAPCWNCSTQGTHLWSLMAYCVRWGTCLPPQGKWRFGGCCPQLKLRLQSEYNRGVCRYTRGVQWHILLIGGPWPGPIGEGETWGRNPSHNSQLQVAAAIETRSHSAFSEITLDLAYITVLSWVTAIACSGCPVSSTMTIGL